MPNNNKLSERRNEIIKAFDFCFLGDQRPSPELRTEFFLHLSRKLLKNGEVLSLQNCYEVWSKSNSENTGFQDSEEVIEKEFALRAMDIFRDYSSRLHSDRIKIGLKNKRTKNQGKLLND